jgi:antitoxin component YwqK of YwqJK toxin-antitoxin module
MFKNNHILHKNWIIFLLLLVSSSGAWAQNGEPINQRSADGKKQGKWIYYGKDRPKSGYPLKGKIEEGNYKNDRREGRWTMYFNDGKTPKLIGEYSNNRPHGSYTKYHSNGKIKEIGNYDDGIYSDSLKRFHPNGKLEYEAAYNSIGKEDGKVRFFYPNGQIEYEYIATNGTPQGKAIRYYENGDIKEVIEYNSDGSLKTSVEKEMESPKVKTNPVVTPTETAPNISKLNVKGGKFQPNGYNKVYNEDNEIWQDGDFKEGKLHNGKVYVYDKDGILLKVKVFKNGVYHSDGQL